MNFLKILKETNIWENYPLCKELMASTYFRSFDHAWVVRKEIDAMFRRATQSTKEKHDIVHCAMFVKNQLEMYMCMATKRLLEKLKDNSNAVSM